MALTEAVIVLPGKILRCRLTAAVGTSSYQAK